MDSIRAFDLCSDPSADVLSLETNRRVTAVLHCDDVTQLLLLNGGSEVEHLHVDVVVPAVREPLCFGSYSVEPGRFVIVDVERPTRCVRLRVRVIGGPQPIVIEERSAKLRVSPARLATAAALAAGFVSLLFLTSGPQRVAKQPPATPARVAAATSHPVRKQPRIAMAPAPAPVVTATIPVETANEPPRPAVHPPVVTVSTSQRHVENGQPITIAFNSNGQQVHIVAKIGPRTIEDRIIGASRGKLVVQPPPSADIRVLTISASAEKKGMTSSRHAIVILLPQIPQSLPITNL